MLIQYPRPGSWAVAFLTGKPGPALVGRAQPDGAEMISVFLPTTPNPTSGFFMMMRRDECIELDITVDAALKYVVSMGVVAPATEPRGRGDALIDQIGVDKQLPETAQGRCGRRRCGLCFATGNAPGARRVGGADHQFVRGRRRRDGGRACQPKQQRTRQRAQARAAGSVGGRVSRHALT